MKRITLLLSAILIAGATYAQDYKNSIGLRFGNGNYDVVGAAFKTFISEPAALEFDLGFNPDSYHDNNVNSASLSGAYQHHFQIADIQGFKWFIGGGAVLAQTFSDWDDYDGFSAGIFPTGGVDYKLKNAPFAFSADVRPTIHLVKGSNLYNNGFYFNGGLTARYTF